MNTVLQAICDSKSIDLSAPRSKSMTESAIQDIKSQKSERSKSDCRAKHGISDVANPFLDLPLDLHKYVHLILIHLS